MDSNLRSPDRRGIAYALMAATLFGANTPVAHKLLEYVSPVLMAGLLYVGSGLGLSIWQLVRPGHGTERAEARLGLRDVPLLLAIVVGGGVIGPLLYMWGLARTPASTSSLLLNLEGVFTAGLAWFVFREHFDRRVVLGLAAIIAGGVLLSWSGRPEAGVPWGSLAIAGACAAWGLDNNLTRKISTADPVQIAAIKGLAAGATNVGFALASGAAWPRAETMLAVGVLGFVCYGCSLVLFILALRHVGSARTGAYISCAPFVGAVLSIVLLRESVTASLAAAAALMLIGLWLYLTERHGHLHAHPAMSHDHLHEHDEHHRHEHEAGVSPAARHAHEHTHEPLLHAHPHYPDIHHRHEH